jgi:hypothetical protein
VGEKVILLYDPADPSSCQIYSFFEEWGLPLLFSAIGAVFAVIGFASRLAADLRDPALPPRTAFGRRRPQGGPGFPAQRSVAVRRKREGAESLHRLDRHRSFFLGKLIQQLGIWSAGATWPCQGVPRLQTLRASFLRPCVLGSGS